MKSIWHLFTIAARTYPLGWRLRFHIWRARRLRGWLEYHDCMIEECQLENQRLARELDEAWPRETGEPVIRWEFEDAPIGTFAGTPIYEDKRAP